MKPSTAATLALLRARTSSGVTPAEARDAVGTDRLAARIHELRQEGHDIVRVNWRARSGKTVARYFLVTAPVQLTAFSDPQQGAQRQVGGPLAARQQGALLDAGTASTVGSRPG